MKSLYKSPCPWKKLQQSRLWAISSTSFFIFAFHYFSIFISWVHRNHFLSSNKHCFEILKINDQMILPQTFYFLTCWWGQCFDGKSKKSKRVPFEKWTPDWLSLYLVFFWYNFPEERQKEFSKTFHKPIFQTFLVIRQIAPKSIIVKNQKWFC